MAVRVLSTFVGVCAPHATGAGKAVEFMG